MSAAHHASLDWADSLVTAFPMWAYTADHPIIGPAMARTALSRQGLHPALPGLGRDAALWLWQRRPLAYSAVALAALALDQIPRADFPRDTLDGLAAQLRQPESTSDIAALEAEPDPAAIAALLKGRIATDPAGWPVLFGQFFAPLVLGGRLDDIAELATHLPDERLAARIAAEARFHLDPDGAEAALKRVDGRRFGWWRTWMLAAVRARRGEADRARAMRSGLWNSLPWLTELTSLLTTPAPSSTADFSAPDAAVAVYSWNKAALLAETLRSLADSELDGAPVLVLDNGSTDETPQVVEAARSLFSEGRFTAIRLPVNVGAPAARNWLLSTEQAKAADWIAFLDDDVILPPDWLAQLLLPARANPSVGTVGCRITEAGPPYGLQSVDYHLLPPQSGDQSFTDLQESLFALDMAGDALDAGQFDTIRPCASVSGCCHLVSTRAVRETGGFEIGFTPTQFDDFERDVRSLLAGMPSLYVGTCAVRHVQHSSLRRAQSATQIAQVYGNKIKLAFMIDEAAATRAVQTDVNLTWTDLRARMQRLMETAARS